MFDFQFWYDILNGLFYAVLCGALSYFITWVVLQW